MLVESASTEKRSNPTVVRKPRRISREEFLREYSDKEDGFKYEWNNGIIEKTIAMNQTQLFLQSVLLRVFINTRVFKDGGLFTSEGDMDTSPTQLRRPDLAIYSRDQVERMKDGAREIAPWLAEIISENDKADKINEKLEEYFKAGVQVVWHIYPASKQVYVYISVENVTICRGKTVCSGAPAVPDFEVTAEELFA
jgi:Uma2 family endonuclease